MENTPRGEEGSGFHREERTVGKRGTGNIKVHRDGIEEGDVDWGG